MHVEAHFSFGLTESVQQSNEVGPAFVKLLHIFFYVQFFYPSEVFSRLGQLGYVDFESRSQRLSQIVEFRFYFDFLEEQTVNLVEGGFLRVLVNVVSQNFLQFLHRDMIYVEFQQNFSSALTIVEVFAEEVAEIGRNFGFEFEGAFWRDGL